MGKGGLPKRGRAAKGRPLRSDSLPRGMPAVALGKASRNAKLKVLAKKVKKPLKPAVKSKPKSLTVENDSAISKGRRNAGQGNEPNSSKSPESTEGKTSKRQRVRGAADRSESPSTTRLSRSSSSSSIAPKPVGSKKAANVKMSVPVKAKPKVSNLIAAQSGILKFLSVDKETETSKGAGKKQTNQSMKRDREPPFVSNASGGPKGSVVSNSSPVRLVPISGQSKSEPSTGSSEIVRPIKESLENCNDVVGEEDMDDESDERLSTACLSSEDLDLPQMGQDVSASLDDNSSKSGKKSGDVNASQDESAPKLLPQLTKKNINQLFPVEEAAGNRLRSGSPASQKSARSLSLQKNSTRSTAGSNPRYATRSDSAVRVLRNGKRSKIKNAFVLEGLVSEAKRKKGPPGLLRFDEDKMEDSRSDFSDEQSSIFSESDSSSFVGTPTRLKNCELEDKLDAEEAQGSISNDEEELPIERIDSPQPTCVKKISDSRLEDDLAEETPGKSEMSQINCSVSPSSASASPLSCVKENLMPEPQGPVVRANNILNDIHTDWDTDGEDKDDSSTWSCKLPKDDLSSFDELVLNVERESDILKACKVPQSIPDESVNMEECSEKSVSPHSGSDGLTMASQNVPASDGQHKLPEPIVIKTSDKNGFAESVDFVAKKSPRIDFELLRRRTKRSMSFNVDPADKGNQNHRILAVEPPKVHETPQLMWTVKAVREPIIPKLRKGGEKCSQKAPSIQLQISSVADSVLKDHPLSSTIPVSDVDLSDSQSSLSSSSLKENINIHPQAEEVQEVCLSKEVSQSASKSSSNFSQSKPSSDSAQVIVSSTLQEKDKLSTNSSRLVPVESAALVVRQSIVPGSESSSLKSLSVTSAFSGVASCADSSLATSAKTPINESNMNQEPVIPSPVKEQDTETDAAAEKRCVTPLSYQSLHKKVEQTPERLNFDDGESFCLRLSPTPTKDEEVHSEQSPISIELPLSEKGEELNKNVPEPPKDLAVDNCDMNRNMEKSLPVLESKPQFQDEEMDTSQETETTILPAEKDEIITTLSEDKDENITSSTKDETVELDASVNDKVGELASPPQNEETTLLSSLIDNGEVPSANDFDSILPADEGKYSSCEKKEEELVSTSKEKEEKLVLTSVEKEENLASTSEEKEEKLVSTSEEKEEELVSTSEEELKLRSLLKNEEARNISSSFDVEEKLTTPLKPSENVQELPKEHIGKQVNCAKGKRGRSTSRPRCLQRSRSAGSSQAPLSAVIQLHSSKSYDESLRTECEDVSNVGPTSEKNDVEDSNREKNRQFQERTISTNQEKQINEILTKKRRSSEGSLVSASLMANECNGPLPMSIECTDSSVKQPGLLSPRLEADVERHHLELNKSNIERKRREITEEEQSPEKKAIKEWIMSSLGLQSVAAAAAASDASRPLKRKAQDASAPSSGRLKAVIKVPKDNKKDKKSERKPLRMVFKNGKPYPGGFEDMPAIEKGMEVDAALRVEPSTSHDGSSVGSGSECGLSNSLLPLDSATLVPGSDPDGKGKPDANLVIPEKSSSFSIHPGRLCSDVCSYCFGKFGSLDTPCHVAQLKSRERQMKIMSVETHLAMDSCLCDACIRYVDRKANCPSAKPQPTQKKDTKSRFEGSMSTCSVNGCIQPARHSLRKKWYIKIRKSVLKKCPIDLDIAHQHMPLPLCPEHYSYMEYFMVCGLCKRRLSRSHMYNLTNTREINVCLEADGIPARLSEKLFVCKLCRYYATLRVKHPRGNFSLSTNQKEFFNSYRKRVLLNHDIEVSEGEENAIDPNLAAARAVSEETSTAQDNLPRGKRRRSKSNATSSAEVEDGEPSRKKSRSSEHTSRAKDKEKSGGHRAGSREREIANSIPHLPGELVTTLPVIHSKSSKNSKSSKSKPTTAEVDPAAAAEWIRKGFAPFFPGEDELALHAKFQFQYEDAPSEREWEKCTSLLQFDKETKKLWQELQRPYGSQSSFLRHLVLMERYWRQGELILSPTATARATSYTRSVQNRLKAYGSTFTARTAPEYPKAVGAAAATPTSTPALSPVSPAPTPATAPSASAPASATATALDMAGGTVLTAAAAAAAVTAVHTHPALPSASPTSTAAAPQGKAAAKPQQGKPHAPAKLPSAQGSPKLSLQLTPQGKQRGTTPMQQQAVQQVKAKPVSPAQENATLKHQLSQPVLSPVSLLKSLPSLGKPQAGQGKAIARIAPKPASSARVSAPTWEPIPHPASGRPQYTSAPVVNLTRSISLTAVPSSPPSVPDLHPIISEPVTISRSPSSSNTTSISVTSSRGSSSGGFVSILPASTTLSAYSQSLSKPASITPIYTSPAVSVTSASMATPGAAAKPGNSTGKVHVTAGGKSFSLTIQQFKKLQALRQQRQLDQQRKRRLAPKSKGRRETGSDNIRQSSDPLKDDLEVVEVRDCESEIHQTFIPTISAVCSGDQAKAMWDEGSRIVENELARAASPPMVEITPIVDTPTSVSVEKLPKIPKALTVTQIRGDSPSILPTVTPSGMSVTITRQACQTPVPLHMSSPALDIFPN